MKKHKDTRYCLVIKKKENRFCKEFRTIKKAFDFLIANKSECYWLYKKMFILNKKGEGSCRLTDILDFSMGKFTSCLSKKTLKKYGLDYGY